MARVLCMTEFIDKDPVRPSSSRSRSRSPSSGPRHHHHHRDDHAHGPSSSAASHARERRGRAAAAGGESPSAARNQCCATTADPAGHGLGRGHHPAAPPSASAGAAARLAPRDDSADHSPVFYAGGFGHPAIENDIREIRKLLKSYVTRLENKDAAARTTKEWRIVARVLDRIFFFCYIGTIVVSLFTIFPRDGGERESGVQELRAVTLTL